MNLFIVAAGVGGAACTAEERAKEQMVDLLEVKDNPEAQLANLDAAIAQSKRDGSLYTRRAAVLYRNDRLRDALEDINQAIQLTKYDPYNFFVKAQVLRAMGKYEEALPLALQAERNSYASSSLYVLLGELYLRRRAYTEAKRYIRKAQEVSPSNEFAFYYKGRILAATGDTANAIDNYKAALAQSPELLEPKRELAGIYIDKLNVEAARPYLEQAYRQAPKDAQVLLYKGVVYQQAQKVDSARYFFEEALVQADTLQEPHYRLGMMLYAQGDNEGAIEHLTKAAKAYGGTSKYLATLASSYERTGQYANSLQQYQRLVQVEPKYTYAYQAIARLKYKLERPQPAPVAEQEELIEQ